MPCVVRDLAQRVAALDDVGRRRRDGSGRRRRGRPRRPAATGIGAALGRRQRRRRAGRCDRRSAPACASRNRRDESRDRGQRDHRAARQSDSWRRSGRRHPVARTPTRRRQASPGSSGTNLTASKSLLPEAAGRRLDHGEVLDRRSPSSGDASGITMRPPGFEVAQELGRHVRRAGGHDDRVDRELLAEVRAAVAVLQRARCRA